MDPNCLLRKITDKFDVVIRKIEIPGGGVIRILKVKDLDVLLDRIDPEAFAEDERLPYWAELWPASVALANYLCRDPLRLNTTALELGCGLALAGISAAKNGACVLCCDYEYNALDFAQYNAYLNSVGDRMRFQYLDWREPDLSGQYSRIIASDILYDREDYPYLVHFLDRFLAQDGIFLASDPRREHVPGFLAALTDRGYQHRRKTESAVLYGRKTKVHIHWFVKG